MKCKNCGGEVGQHDRFCGNCGENNDCYIPPVQPQRDTFYPGPGIRDPYANQSGGQNYNQNYNAQNSYQNYHQNNQNYNQGYNQNYQNQQYDPNFARPFLEGQTLGIVGLIFAFFVPLVAFICSGIGLSQANRQLAMYPDLPRTAKSLNTAALIVAGCMCFLNFMFMFMIGLY